MSSNIKLLYVDLFCGAGGTSTGVEKASHKGKKCAKVIACVNHDANAIASHAANHPDAVHFMEDIRTLELTPMVEHLQRMRAKYPDAHVVLWASLECTNFSKAKGGMPRDADSRTLAEHLFRYIDAIAPDYIQIENVEEFMCWGDIDENGKPISRDRGTSYLQWVKNVCAYGYDYDWRILNAADFGAYTSRKRFFGQFAKTGLPIAFPIPTHSKCRSNQDELFKDETMQPWKPVREVLDLNDEGESIFGRKKPLVEKTLERIYAGLVKFVAGGKEAFLVKYNSVNGKTGKYAAPSIDEPCPTVACQNRLGLVSSNFIVNYRFNNKGSSIEEPAPAICTVGQIGVAGCKFLANEYSGGGQTSDIEAPCPAVLTTPKQKVVSVQYLMNPYSFKSDGGSIDKPCFTLIARMDKMPPYLISTEKGIAIEVYETDSPMTVSIKEFMALYGIADIRMRMLNIGELKRIMGFPTDYVLVGTQAEQKKYIGNAVEVNMSRVLCEAICKKLN
ncbi:MAG: DNA cytosine methyltransferase [Prevotella sp.]|nr:DNA cytosine methyltransferase [Prevotella sp.]MBR1880476.1 DNA cytosine methyltransferase [Prevotella sp.]